MKREQDAIKNNDPTALAELYGFALEGTGGGCDAFTWYEQSGIGYWILTAHNDCNVPKSVTEKVDLSFVNTDQGWTGRWSIGRSMQETLEDWNSHAPVTTHELEDETRYKEVV